MTIHYIYIIPCACVGGGVLGTVSSSFSSLAISTACLADLRRRLLLIRGASSSLMDGSTNSLTLDACACVCNTTSDSRGSTTLGAEGEDAGDGVDDEDDEDDEGDDDDEDDDDDDDDDEDVDEADEEDADATLCNLSSSSNLY